MASRPLGRLAASAAALALAGILAPQALASGLVDRNASRIRLAVNGRGQALVTYRAAGRTRHVLVYGAVNALPPSQSTRQVRFTIDYTGGRETQRRSVWERFRNRCRPYRGPALAWLVAACTAPDGSSWALQSWQRMLPHRGFAPWLPSQSVWELHISHWTGPLAELDVWTDWIHGGEAHDLFGRFTYGGVPVHGFRTKLPQDGYVRYLYIDTFDSRYGAGWKRETAVAARNPHGNFCYSFYATRDASLPGAPVRPPGNGTRYRVTAVGPGVTPDVMWEGPGLPDFDPRNPTLVAREREMNALVDQIAGSDPVCSVH
jgi:hypothetical protein